MAQLTGVADILVQVQIYFTSLDERQTIKNYLDGHIKGKYNIEILPLENFYDAEEYHQDYLYKNPNGYCHINMRLIKDKEKKQKD